MNENAKRTSIPLRMWYPSKAMLSFQYVYYQKKSLSKPFFAPENTNVKNNFPVGTRTRVPLLTCVRERRACRSWTWRASRCSPCSFPRWCCWWTSSGALRTALMCRPTSSVGSAGISQGTTDGNGERVMLVMLVMLLMSVMLVMLVMCWSWWCCWCWWCWWWCDVSDVGDVVCGLPHPCNLRGATYAAKP